MPEQSVGCRLDVGRLQPAAAVLAKELAAQTIVYDYRLAPEHKFPVAIEDALLVYKYVLRSGYDPKKIIFAGDSAGGGITFALMLAARHEGLPLRIHLCRCG